MSNFLVAAWRWWLSVLLWFYIRSHLYKGWSHLHRFLYDRPYAKTEISTYATLSDLRDWISKQNWVADGWTELFDAVCSPEKVQAVGQEGDHNIGDCDEFAVYLTAAITKSLNAGLMQADKIRNPRFLTVCWMNREGKSDGHNVCLLEHVKDDGTVQYAYMDYGMPRPPQASPADVAQTVARDYAKKGDVVGIIAWSVSALDLTPIEVHIGRGWMNGRT